LAHDVFISYSSKDKTTADAVCAVLERDGIRCWIAPRDVVAGHDWAESIIQAIHGSKAFVLLFSGFSNTSGQIKREVERAADREIPIIPFRLDDIAPNESLEFFISSPHWMDAFTPPLEGHIKQLSSTILQLLAQVDPARAAALGSAPEPAQSPPPAAAPNPPAQPAARPAIGSLAPWLIVAALAVVILVGAVVMLRGHGAPPAPSAQEAAASGALAASAQQAAASAAPSPPVGQAAASAAAPQPPQEVAAIAPLQPTASAPRAAAGSAGCVVTDPTPTPLNVRVTPNGKIAQTLSNGAAVHAVKQVEAGGQTWSLIGTGQSGPILGWVYSSYIACGN
jgi:hypothetical protein